MLNLLVWKEINLYHFVNPLLNENVLCGYMSRTDAHVKWREVVVVGQTLRSISNQADLQLLNVLVILTLSQSSFNYDTDHERLWRTLGDRHCGLVTFILWSTMQTHASLASLHASQVRALTIYNTVSRNDTHVLWG